MSTNKKNLERYKKEISLEALVSKEPLPHFFPIMKSLRIEDLLPKNLLFSGNKFLKRELFGQKNKLYRTEVSKFAYLINNISIQIKNNPLYNQLIDSQDISIQQRSKQIKGIMILALQETSKQIIGLSYQNLSSKDKKILDTLKDKFYSIHDVDSTEAISFEYGLLRTLFLQRNKSRKVSGEPTVMHPVRAALNYISFVDDFLEFPFIVDNYDEQDVKKIRHNLLSSELLTSLVAHDSTEDFSSKIKNLLGVRLLPFKAKFGSEQKISLEDGLIHLDWVNSKKFQNKVGLKCLEQYSVMSEKYLISLLLPDDQIALQRSFDIAHSTNNYLSSIYPSVDQARLGLQRRQKRFKFEEAPLYGKSFSGLTKLSESDDNENTLDPSSVVSAQKWILNTLYKRKINGKFIFGTSFLKSKKSASSELKVQRFLKDYLSRRKVFERATKELASIPSTKLDIVNNPIHSSLVLSVYASFEYSQRALINATTAFKQEIVLNGSVPKEYLFKLLYAMKKSKETDLYDNINNPESSFNKFDLGKKPYEEDLTTKQFSNINYSLSEAIGHMNDSKLSLSEFAKFRTDDGAYESDSKNSERLKALSMIFYFGLFGALEKNMENALKHLPLSEYGFLKTYKTRKLLSLNEKSQEIIKFNLRS